VLIVRLQVLLQEVDPLRLFGESKCYWGCRLSEYDYSHCDEWSYVKEEDRGRYSEKELLCCDSVIKPGAHYLYVWLNLSLFVIG
jgi:hypothetical protein